MPCTRVIMPACCVASRVVALCIVDPRPEGCGRQPRGPSGRLPPDGLAARRRSHRARDLQLDRRLRVATAWQMSTPMSLGRAVALLALRTAIGASVALLSVRMRFMVAVLVGQYLQRGNLCHFVKVGGLRWHVVGWVSSWLLPKMQPGIRGRLPLHRAALCEKPSGKQKPYNVTLSAQNASRSVRPKRESGKKRLVTCKNESRRRQTLTQRSIVDWQHSTASFLERCR
jgi:hypothetical protein